MEFHWSRSPWSSSNQNHWTTEASSRPVGVSALYSSSFGGAVVAQVEAPVEARGATVEEFLQGFAGDAEPERGQPDRAHGSRGQETGRLDAHPVESVGGGLQFVDLGHRQLVVRLLVPPGALDAVVAAGGAVDEALFLDGLLPAIARRVGDAAHQEPALPPRWPKPPVRTVCTWPPVTLPASTVPPALLRPPCT